MTDPTDDILGEYVGKQIDGGCDDCAAYREVDRIGDAIWVIHVRHDPGCPTLARLRRSA